MIRIYDLDSGDTIGYEKSLFPGGEVHVRVIDSVAKKRLIMSCGRLKGSDDVMTMLMLADAIKRSGGIISTLSLPYLPYARQDRVCNSGEALSVKVMTDLVNAIGAERVKVFDPHSDVVGALVENLDIIHQHDLLGFFDKDILAGRIIICPDAGAEKKILKLKMPYILCTKERDTQTGDIKRTIVHHHGSLEGKDCIIIDDICDGGRTFIEIAKELRKKNAGKIYLYVTHGIFSNGFGVFLGLIDEIYYFDEDMEPTTKEITDED